MTFSSPQEANRYLLGLILEEAQRDGESFSEADVHELRSPDCGHTADEDEALQLKLPEDHSQWSLRARAARCLRGAYQRAKASDPEAPATFAAVYRSLSDSQFLLGNLTHADAPVLRAVEALRLRPAFDLVDGLLSLTSPFSAVPSPAAHRPLTVGLWLLTSLFVGAVLLSLISLVAIKGAG